MTVNTSDFESLRFSTVELRPRDRIPFFRDVYGRTIAKFDKEPVGERFSCSGHVCRLPDLNIARVATTAIRANRTRAMAEECSDYLFLCAHTEGVAMFSRQRREMSITGNSFLVSTGDSMRVECTSGRYLVVGMPRTVLAPMLANPDAAQMSVLPGTAEPFRLLVGYIDLLTKHTTLIDTPEMLRLVVNHVHDLAAMALGATRDATEIAAGRGLRAARLRAIKADIAQHLAEEVTASALSARHGVSPRYIRSLFEGESTSLSQFVLAQRLMRVHRMLTDPRHDDRTISDIAFGIGFNDISTFNREFRRRFGVTPSDVRHNRQR
jgi:AraC-like DNA-binding protein